MQRNATQCEETKSIKPSDACFLRTEHVNVDVAVSLEKAHMYFW